MPCYATLKMKDMTTYFNEKKKDSENADLVQKICSQLVFDPSLQERHGPVQLAFSFNEDRRFVLQGDVLVLKERTPPKPFPISRAEDRHVILFNDVLLMCLPPFLRSKRKQKAIRQKGTIEFNPNQMVIKEIIELWKIQLVDLPSSYGEGVFMVQSFNDKFIVCAGTEKGKHQWVSSISSTIEKLFKKPPLLVQKREAEPEKLPLKAKFVLDHSI